jgi:CspA family cold shock protein
VVAFDEPVGLGTVREVGGGGHGADGGGHGADGVADHPFHCTAIADGSRDIAVGTEVTFRLVHGRLGRLEATDLHPG